MKLLTIVRRSFFGGENKPHFINEIQKKAKQHEWRSLNYLSTGNIVITDAPFTGSRKFAALVFRPGHFRGWDSLGGTFHCGSIATLHFDFFGIDDESWIDVDGDVCPFRVSGAVFVGYNALVLAGVFVSLKKCHFFKYILSKEMIYKYVGSEVTYWLTKLDKISSEVTSFPFPSREWDLTKWHLEVHVEALLRPSNTLDSNFQTKDISTGDVDAARQVKTLQNIIIYIIFVKPCRLSFCILTKSCPWSVIFVSGCCSK